MTSQRRTLTLVVMCVGMFLVLLEVTIVNVALPRLRAELGAGVRSLQWIVDGYGRWPP
jgi:DHA2 family methylenomycin A resistance protein-like MFS transporter